MRSGLILTGLAALVLGFTSAGRAQPAAAPWWLGSRAGVSCEVLPPWTPVEVAGAKVKVWGRSYEFGAGGLPSAVVTKDANMLAGPITLRGTADGKELAWTGGTCRTAEARPEAARVVGSVESGNLHCQATATIEYDGMIRCDLRLMPKSGKVTVERLLLEMPLDARHVGYMHYWPGRWGSVANSKALPADGYRSAFQPFLWLGDEQRGLAWFCESERNFFNAKGSHVVEVERKDRRVVLRVNLISVPQSIDGPLEYTFGLQATPVRPPAPDAWDDRICHMGAYRMQDQPYTPPGGKPTTLLAHLAQSGVRTICFHEQWTDIQAYPSTTHGKELKALADACRREHIRLLLYLGYEISTLAPEWAAWGEKCIVGPRQGGYKRTYQPQPDQTAYNVCYRSAWQDFLAAHLEKLMTEYGIGGVYLDGTSEPWGCTNAAHGCGNKRPDGSVSPTYPIFDTRSMMRRIYTIVRHHDPQGQVNVHQSTCMVIPTLAFATSYWDGEQLQGLPRPKTPGAVLPLDAFRCEFMGHNWGVPAELLHYPSGPFKRSEAMGMALLHDVPVRPSSLGDLDELARVWRLFDAFDRHAAAWLPYWDNAGYVASRQPRVKVSVYNRPGKGFVAVVANTGTESCQAEVSFDLSALKQPAALAAHDVLTGKPIAFADGRLAAPLESLGFVMFRAEPR